MSSRILRRRAGRLLLRQPWISEIKGYAPYRAEGDKRIYYPRNQSGGAAEQPRNKVELEDTHKSPVYAAHDKEKQRDSVKYFHGFLDRPFIRIPYFKVNAVLGRFIIGRN